jgi:voltage-gated potassium channel
MEKKGIVSLAPLRRRMLGSIGFVLLLIVVGVAGFALVEHESLLDALFTTVSALSTVGYSPPHPFSAAGKVLALVLIMGGLIGLALVISTMTEYFLEADLAGALERRRMDKAIAQLRDHFIISGFGRVGREVAQQFVLAGVPFVVVDHNAQAAAGAASAGYLHVVDDASRDEILLQVGLARARGLIACADSDVNNVYVTLSARASNPNIFIVARAAQPDAEPKLFKAGANRVVSPYVMAGQHMAELAARPLVADYLNLLFDGKEIDVRIQELAVEASGEIAGRSVRDIHSTLLAGAFVLALDRQGERIHTVGPDLVLRPGDRLLVVGTGEQLSKLTTIK